ncbi:MAG: glycosyltransferase family 4 protein [Bacteroidetes bacterium]|nr:glycosyltransferase family 4 protein [Bacteroidota bacterium]
MNRKKALIITYYWPPSGGSGVQRWLKFSKYMREFGWEPIIYTPSNPEFPMEDQSFLKDIPDNLTVIKRPIREPYKFYKFLSGKKPSEKVQTGFLNESSKPGFLEKAFRWLRGNLFIPDARKFWIKPSVRFLSKWIKENHIDIVITTGPPHSMHLIGKALKEKLNIKWVADFRDPWTGIYYFEQLQLSQQSRKKHKELEKNCLDAADHIITVGNKMKSDFEIITKNNISVINNGFDSSDFENLEEIKPDKFRIMYTGNFLPDQNPKELWESLGELIATDITFKNNLELCFIGKTDSSIITDIEMNGLKGSLKLLSYLHHNEIPKLQKQAYLMLLSINRFKNASYIITGKVYEYLASEKPILAICPEDSDVAMIIKETSSGWIIPFGEKELIKSTLLNAYEDFLSGSKRFKTNNISKYSRRELTRQLCDMLNTQIHNSNHDIKESRF